MGAPIGGTYGDTDPAGDAGEQGTQPGEGRLDKPATTGTHRGWGDPQPGELEHRVPDDEAAEAAEADEAG